MVILDDVLQTLVARTWAPGGAFGAVLDKAEDMAYVRKKCGDEIGLMKVAANISGNALKARDAVEEHIFRTVPVIKCLDGFLATPDTDRIFSDRQELFRCYQASEICMPRICLEVLRSFHERNSGSGEERALAEVYEKLRTMAPKRYPAALHDEETLAQAFREGKAKPCRSRAAEIYADSLLSLSAFTAIWNRRSMRRVQ